MGTDTLFFSLALILGGVIGWLHGHDDGYAKGVKSKGGGDG